jgi:hypothetical protein
MTKRRAALVAIGAALTLVPAGCEVGKKQEQDDGRLGIDPSGFAAPEPTGTLRSPSGRTIQAGERDELGWTLPLDVRRPRPGTERPAPPRRPRPAARGRGGFEEHRLGLDDGHTQNETTIDAQADTLVAGWNNYTDDTLVMGVARSIDAGHTWTSELLSGHNAMSDPAVKTGGAGKWYYAYLAGGGAGGTDIDIYVRRSLDAGATWQTPVVVTNNSSFDDKPYLDASADEVLVAWADFAFSPAKVRAARSLDGGSSFGPAQTLADVSVGGNGACPVLSPEGSYHVFWRDSFQDSLWISTSSDQGGTWSTDRGIVAMNPLPSALPGGFRMVNFPSADADPISGDLVVLWNDQRFGNADILSIRSTDDGATWSEPIRVNDDAGAAAQFFPWIDFDETGVAHAVWYDRRGNGFDIDVYTSRSEDGGASWEPNGRVTSAAFVPVLPWDSTIDFIGDYNGIAATATATFPFYQDSRRGEQDVYVARLPSPATAVEPLAPGSPAAGLVASPNPFHGGVTIRGTLEHEKLEVVGIDGRRCASLVGNRSGVVSWDGRDEEGRELPSGVYFVRPVHRVSGSIRIVKLR